MFRDRLNGGKKDAADPGEFVEGFYALHST